VKSPLGCDTLLPGSAPRVSLPEARAYCARLARTHYENFTVGSLLLPRDLRRHFFHVYAFCRSVDDLGDEAPGDRLTLLDAWEEDLQRCYDGVPRHPVFTALRETIDAFAIPREPFLRLVEANRMDQQVRRHATFRDLLFYCDHSANPVGHLVLYILGHADEERRRLSDLTCTALQLANFWQDVARDWEMGRVYLPQEDLARFGVREEQIRDRVCDGRFRALMKFEVDRARAMFLEGLPLAERVAGTARLDLRLFSRGGMLILDAIERQGFDVLSRRPELGRAAKARLLLSELGRHFFRRRGPDGGAFA
jgi:squalene synthase HpnC